MTRKPGIGSLLNGNREWQERHAEKNYSKLAKKQSPDTIVFCCSDSRVVPEHIFNAEPNEIFTVRNVANKAPVKDKSAMAALSYAINHLGIKNITILGHTSCGGIHGLAHMKGLEKEIKNWLDYSKTAKKEFDNILKKRKIVLKNEEYENALVETSVLWQIKGLLSHKLIKKNNAKLYGWIYDIKTGKVYTDFKALKNIGILENMLERLKLEIKENGLIQEKKN